MQYKEHGGTQVTEVGIRNRGGHKEQSWTQGPGRWAHKEQRCMVIKKAEAIYERTLEGTETNVKTRKRAGHKEQKYSPKRSRGGHGNICKNNHVVPSGQNEAQTAEVIPRNK
jgi:hypothetical protein